MQKARYSTEPAAKLNPFKCSTYCYDALSPDRLVGINVEEYSTLPSECKDRAYCNAICGENVCNDESYCGTKLSDYTESITYNTEGAIRGLPSHYRGKTLDWNFLGQLTSAGGTEYVYDGYGKRIKKGDTVFIYDLGGRLIKQACQSEQVEESALEFYYDGNGLNGFKYDNNQYIYRKNAQGDITHILDMSGNTVVKYVYDAWGNHTCVYSDGTPITDPNHVGNLNPFRYRSYFYDIETGLYYLTTRYYDPEIGRFINADSIENLDPSEINGLNLYAYVGNNPIMFTDPFGTTKWWEWLLAGIVVAGLIVGTVFTGGLLGAAFLGAAIGAGISLGSQAINYAVNGVDFSWGQFALDIGIGALTGAIGASGISRSMAALVGGVIGGVSSIASDLIAGNNINWYKFGMSVGIGAIAGALGGAGAKNTKAMDKAINGSAAVVKAQNSVAKVGDKMANGLYATARGAKSAYTQTMNRMSREIFKAAAQYSKQALTGALKWYGIGTAAYNGIDILLRWGIKAWN